MSAIKQIKVLDTVSHEYAVADIGADAENVLLSDGVTDVDTAIEDLQELLEQLQELIAKIEKYTAYLGVTTTVLTDGSTTNPINITGKYEEVTPVGSENPSALGWYEYNELNDEYILTQDTSVQEGKKYFTTMITAKTGNIVNYGSAEFIWNGSAWNKFGDIGGLGALAFKDNASVSYTPAGTMTDPTISLSGTGIAAAQNISLTSTTKNIPNVTSAGSMPTFTVDANGVLSITGGAVPTLGTEITVHDVTGATADSSSVNIAGVTATATGTAFSGTAATITVS